MVHGTCYEGPEAEVDLGRCRHERFGSGTSGDGVDGGWVGVEYGGFAEFLFAWRGEFDICLSFLSACSHSSFFSSRLLLVFQLTNKN